MFSSQAVTSNICKSETPHKVLIDLCSTVRVYLLEQALMISYILIVIKALQVIIESGILNPSAAQKILARSVTKI